MIATLLPQTRELDERDIRALLARNHVARIAFSLGGAVEIRPIHYVFQGGYVYGRAEGQELPEMGREPVRVAFEVDEVRSVFRWRSVTGNGQLEVLDPAGRPEEWEQAVCMLRRLVRDAFREEDPLPHLAVVFRIRLEQVSGMALSPVERERTPYAVM
jgi:uncharacterized protein